MRYKKPILSAIVTAVTTLALTASAWAYTETSPTVDVDSGDYVTILNNDV